LSLFDCPSIITLAAEKPTEGSLRAQRLARLRGAQNIMTLSEKQDDDAHHNNFGGGVGRIIGSTSKQLRSEQKRARRQHDKENNERAASATINMDGRINNRTVAPSPSAVNVVKAGATAAVPPTPPATRAPSSKGPTPPKEKDIPALAKARVSASKTEIATTTATTKTTVPTTVRTAQPVSSPATAFVDLDASIATMKTTTRGAKKQLVYASTSSTPTPVPLAMKAAVDNAATTAVPIKTKTPAMTTTTATTASTSTTRVAATTVVISDSSGNIAATSSKSFSATTADVASVVRDNDDNNDDTVDVVDVVDAAVVAAAKAAKLSAATDDTVDVVDVVDDEKRGFLAKVSKVFGTKTTKAKCRCERTCERVYMRVMYAFVSFRQQDDEGVLCMRV
jgi:hypothetical protein